MKRTFNMKTLLVILALLMPTSVIAWSEGNMAEEITQYDSHFAIDGNFIAFCMKLGEQAEFLFDYRFNRSGERITREEAINMLKSNRSRNRGHTLMEDVVDLVFDTNEGTFARKNVYSRCLDYAREQEFEN